MTCFRYHILLLGGMLLLMAAACGDSTIAEPDEVQIRLENTSSFTMANISVSFPDERVEYGDLVPGETGRYRTLSRAYRYAPLEAVIDGKTALGQPIDYVGEEFLANGRYTYRVIVNEELLQSDPEHALFLELTVD